MDTVSVRSSRSPMSAERSWRSRAAEVPPRMILTMAASQIAPAAWSPHLSPAWRILSNKVQAVLDGRWRSLDGRPMHAAVVGVSAHYNAVLADRLTRELGVEWEFRARGPDRNPQRELAGVGDDLVEEFSSRSRAIEAEKDRLIEEYLATHGRRPSERTIVELRAQATLATRPEKQIRALADLTADWRERATRLLGVDATQ